MSSVTHGRTLVKPILAVEMLSFSHKSVFCMTLAWRVNCVLRFLSLF